MARELEMWLGPTGIHHIKKAYEIAFRVHLEELILGDLTTKNWSQFMTLSGTEHLDSALSRGKGVVLLTPHAGNIMMMIAALGFSGYSYNQYAARGLAPASIAANHPEQFGVNWWRKEIRSVRESNENRLPARFMTSSTSTREIYRRLSSNEIVGIAYDGRIGGRFVKVNYLNRLALLNPGPYRLAATTGATIIPAFCASPSEGINTCHLQAGINGDNPQLLMSRFLHEAAEPWLNEHPAEYGMWLAHCRVRAAVDDHPLFFDYAVDERWRKHDA